MVTIHLTQGQVTVIDDKHADQAEFTWYAQKKGKTFYAMRHIQKPDGKQTTVYLHQEIARRMGIVGAPDHIDRDGLNNLESNLRQDPGGRNGANRGRQSNNSSGYIGVSLREALGKYRAYISVDRKQRHLGFFDDKVEAARVRDRAALEVFGEFAVLNFPMPRSL